MHGPFVRGSFRDFISFFLSGRRSAPCTGIVSLTRFLVFGVFEMPLDR